ncbi:mannose-6-phosphate isomerase [Spiroplasma corruscae]|uniref:Mannose-6-phosphate isomerase n=1 Tax=Spiroplasma corruscae TaxID=216934 RepID=A0A222ENI3_9MOLU|nr:type I phosphomannose isomerase catalytic subunit [Spiroplasma corruscae]ASP27854.1 mannose-6-phosphate isomerase [Spiroplasma corruscae]
MDIIKVLPYFSEKIWGGNELKNYGFDIGDKKVGEAWIVSAHPNGISWLQINGEKVSLLDFFNKNKSFFGDYQEQFPILAKIITANDYLSVQVHPNDNYALKKHKSLGKPECWYIMNCPDNARIIYGHKATTLEEFKNAVVNDKWSEILKEKHVNKGDFLYVEPGKIHAITPSLTVFELQRSSDITYRLYDYNRIDNGRLRELHIEDSLNNIKIPDVKDNVIQNKDNFDFNSDFFSLYKLKVINKKTFSKPKNALWLNLTIISGEGSVNGFKMKMGESAICNSNLEELFFMGNMELIIYWVCK